MKRVTSRPRTAVPFISFLLVCVSSLTKNNYSLAFHASFRTRRLNAFPGSELPIARTAAILAAAPKEALKDIVIPSILAGSAGGDAVGKDDDPRVWVPQTDCLDFRPLCLCVSQGYYVNLLRFRGGGVLGCHRHSSPVHAYTLRGGWGYREHDWHASEGTYVFEPPGETHTLIVDEDCDEMVAMFHVTGSLLYVDPDDGEGGKVIGFDDVFTKLEKAKKWYAECGLGEDYVQQFVR